MSDQTPPRILFAFHWYSEALHEGALKYCQEHGWRGFVLNSENAANFPEGSYDGVLGTLPSEGPVYEFVSKAKVPVVELSLAHPRHQEWGRFPSDSEAVGRMAADYLRRRPVASFAFVDKAPWTSSDARWKGFREALVAQGEKRPMERFHTARAGDAEMVDRRPGAVDLNPVVLDRIGTFLKEQPLPVGVFGSVNVTAHQVLEAALKAGLRVPGDLYLLASEPASW
jgi:DNA-binding LacI/PurR family transcriptional regulator